jgi:serine/threonine-protein kinase
MPTLVASPGARRTQDAGKTHAPSLGPAGVTRTASERLFAKTSHLSGASAPTVFALHGEEADRATGFARTVLMLSLASLAVLPFLGGVPWLKLATSVAFAAMGGVSGWVWWAARDQGRYTVRMFRVMGLSCVCSWIVIVYYTGVFSPAALGVTLGVAFFGLGDDHVFGIVFCAVCTATYVILSGLIIGGVVADRGLYTAEGLPLLTRFFALGIVPTVFVLTLFQARMSRRATYAAVESLHAALRLAQQREAQLNEANQNLDVALRAGAGQKGQYSGFTAGRYRLGEVVGRGAMGEVYAASHVDSGDRAAVKLLLANTTDEANQKERFLREAEITQRLHVPNVVGVYEVGNLDEGVPFIAMELLQGHDLAFHLRKKRQLALEDLVVLANQVASGLKAAHDAGIVHRDIKPQNLFLAAREAATPIWKILDFGVSKLRGSKGTLTQHAVVGTPGYMSPEQAQGLEADPRSDVFSLGAVLYRALTGRPPFGGPDMPQVLFEIVYRTPTRPSDLVTALPRDVDVVLAIALAKKPEDRFASAQELAEAFALATRKELLPALRSQGDGLILAYPWGKTRRELG